MSQTNQQIEYVAPSELEPHQLNREIYTNRDISELVSKIDRYGFQQEHELLATPEGKILSGHRRWRAALELGLDKVPVRRKRVEGGDDACSWRINTGIKRPPKRYAKEKRGKKSNARRPTNVNLRGVATNYATVKKEKRVRRSVRKSVCLAERMNVGKR